MFLQQAAQRRWLLEKGDVKSAFLQGEELARELYVQPTEEMGKLLGLLPGQLARLRKAACGLVQAPRAWHQAVSACLRELGWRQLETDPCAWIL
eukprot:3842712-Alexandrium_andersonii.AAC.1